MKYAGQITQIAANDDFYLPSPTSNTTTAYVPNKLNQYGSVGGQAASYDAAGNLISWYHNGVAQTYTYDAENRLRTAATNGTTTPTIFYDYDPLGRRISKRVGGTVTRYLLDGDEEIAELSDSGVVLRRYIMGPAIDDRIATAEGSSTSSPTKTYFHTNHQGSVIAMADAAGNATGCAAGVNCQRLSYDEYGRLGAGSVTTGQPYRYTGRRFDEETKLYYYRARYYSPELGRFLQTDPIGYEDDVNLYAYVANDPLNSIDPDGKRDIFIGGAADKDRTRIVQDYAKRQERLNPGRDVQYFSYAEKKQIAAAISAPLKEGEPLNVIGHSLGGREALRQAHSTEVEITNLITIDPVGSAGDGTKPSNVQSYTNVQADPAKSDRNRSDTIASLGRAVFGTTDTSGADSNKTVTDSHGDFPSMMSETGAQKKVDDSYTKGPQ